MKVTPEQAQAVFNNAKCLYDQTQLEEALDQLALKITAVLKKTNPLLISVMNGGFVPAGHLLTRLNFPLQVDYLHATRYREKLTGAGLDWIVYPQNSLKGRTVLIVDDILDEGETLRSILDYCIEKEVEQVYSCVLVEKEHDRKSGCKHADFVGLTVEDAYVFGFGMDYKGYLRNVPGIYAVQEDK